MVYVCRCNVCVHAHACTEAEDNLRVWSLPSALLAIISVSLMAAVYSRAVGHGASREPVSSFPVSLGNTAMINVSVYVRLCVLRI